MAASADAHPLWGLLVTVVPAVAAVLFLTDSLWRFPLAFLAALLGYLLVPLVWATLAALRAPYRQRDEARTLLRPKPSTEPAQLSRRQAQDLIEGAIEEASRFLGELAATEDPEVISEIYPRLVEWEQGTHVGLERYHEQAAVEFGLGSFEDVLPTNRRMLMQVVDAKMNRLNGLLQMTAIGLRL